MTNTKMGSAVLLQYTFPTVQSCPDCSVKNIINSRHMTECSAVMTDYM